MLIWRWRGLKIPNIDDNKVFALDQYGGGAKCTQCGMVQCIGKPDADFLDHDALSNQKTGKALHVGRNAFPHV